MEKELENNNAASGINSAAVSGDLLKDLLSNPELIARVGTVLGAMRGGEGSGKSGTQTASGVGDAVQTSAAVPSVDGIAALLQNPSLLAQLPQMLAVLKPLMENGTIKPPASDTAVAAKSSSVHPREGLLLSLKPFLSKERCDAVDTILRISQLGDVLGKRK